MEPKLEFKVLINYPYSYFKLGDILVQSERIPKGSVGKFIDETTGWAWVTNPFDYPEVFRPQVEDYLAKVNQKNNN